MPKSNDTKTVSDPHSDTVKQRDICFHRLSEMADPVNTVLELLEEINGVISVKRSGETCIQIEYRLDQINLKELEYALVCIGYRLDQSFVQRCKRAYYHFVEDTQIANMVRVSESKSTTSIFINQYHQREHGCRDERPPYYHHYD